MRRDLRDPGPGKKAPGDFGQVEHEVLGPPDIEARMQRKSSTFDDVVTAADETCLIAFTSGTTGQPKGVELTHDCWVY